MSTSKKSFLLLTECYGKKFIDTTTGGGKKASEKTVAPVEIEVQLLPGSLLREVRHQDAALRSLDIDGVFVFKPPSSLSLQELEPAEVDLLLPISIHRERLRVYADLGTMDSVFNLGSHVLVYPPCDGEPREGIVRYWGPVQEIGRGVWFGIELLKGLEKGACDGSIKGRRYFTCPENKGVFVPLSHLEPMPKSSNVSGKSPAPISLEAACAAGSPPPPLALGDRVVWISDEGPEYGVVRWLGKLPDVGNDWMVGLEFDNPVGTGTGKYNDHQLFEAKLNHASLVPIIGLMKAEDFTDASNHSPPKPTRTKKNESSPVTEKTKVVENGLGSTTAGIRGSPSFHRKPPLEPGPLQVSLPVPASRHLSPAKPESVNPLYEYELLTEKGESGQKVKVSKVADPEGGTTKDLDVGSVVEVSVNQQPCFGVIRWIGEIPEVRGTNKLVAGIEMEEESACCTDGTFNGKRYFQCSPKKAFFVRLSQCRKDSRFQESSATNDKNSKVNGSEIEPSGAVFGSIECPVVTGDVPPLSSPEKLYGKNKGIQGHHNSCYLDATLFAMFSCTCVFDSLLHRPRQPSDIPEYEQVQKVLKEEIVNPLRTNYYVRADRVMKLRTLLEKLSSVSGLTSEEKDPEEFLNSLLNQILKAEPFLKLSSNQESYLYQLFLDKDERLTLPTVQQLFDKSFLMSEIKLQEVPACLLIQMPRCGRQYKMYPRILPSQYLDITDVLYDSPRQCSVCGQLAEFECKECFGQIGEGLESIAFCGKCLEKSHSHKKRAKHHSTRLQVPAEFLSLQDHVPIPRIYMELFAVLCIETSHYVSFVKCGSGPDAPWCFFDSMADRKGEQNGYNIPEVVEFRDFQWWLSEEGASFLAETKDDKALPGNARRLLCDAYMCLYQSPEVMMYR